MSTPLNEEALKALGNIEKAIAKAGYNCTCASTPDNVTVDKDWLDVNLRELRRALLTVAQPEVQANSKPNQNFEVVNSVEELDALPVGAVVYATNHIGPAEKFAVGWMGCGNNAAWSSALLARDGLPARVLYLPEVTP